MDYEKKRLQTLTNWKVGGAFLGAIVFGLIMVGTVGKDAVSDPPPNIAAIVLIARLALLALFCWGCADYARSKGYSPWVGLVGILACIGLLVLVLLPDNWKSNAPPRRY